MKRYDFKIKRSYLQIDLALLYSTFHFISKLLLYFQILPCLLEVHDPHRRSLYSCCSTVGCHEVAVVLPGPTFHTCLCAWDHHLDRDYKTLMVYTDVVFRCYTTVGRHEVAVVLPGPPLHTTLLAGDHHLDTEYKRPLVVHITC